MDAAIDDEAAYGVRHSAERSPGFEIDEISLRKVRHFYSGKESETRTTSVLCGKLVWDSKEQQSMVETEVRHRHLLAYGPHRNSSIK
jgi:hypothetical protein